MRRKPLLLTSLLVVTLLPLSSYLYRQLSRPALAAPSAETLALQQAVTIYRDELGVPHIHGQTDNAVAFGFAFAHSEDDFPTIQGSLAAARGQLGLLLPGELAGANDLVVAGLEVEERLTVGGILALVAFLHGGVCLHRCDAALRRCLGDVHLARENGFRVAGLQDEVELTVVCLAEFIPTCHG